MSEARQSPAAPSSFETIDVKPIAGALGAEIHGVDLAKPLDNRTWDEIHRAWLENNVIFFRDQDMTPQQYLSFAKRWGGIHLHPYMKGLHDIPEVFEIIKKEDDTTNFGGRWHDCQIVNLSGGGGAFRSAIRPLQGASVLVHLRGVGIVRAKVVGRGHATFALQFNEKDYDVDAMVDNLMLQANAKLMAGESVPKPAEEEAETPPETEAAPDREGRKFLKAAKGKRLHALIGD